MANRERDIAELVANRIKGFDPTQAKKANLPWTLETLFTHKDGLGLRTASPLQRAICRVMDGSPLGELGIDPHVIAAFGDTVTTLPQQPPKEMVVLSGIRTGKSLISAARAVQQTQTCDVSGLVAGEVPRVSVLSLKKDLAQVVFSYVCALCQGDLVRDRVIGEPTMDSVLLRHPSGRPVEIKVAAGHRAGSSLVARWSAGVIFDEAPRMVGADEGVVNLDDARAAVLGRMLPGATILYPGSPWAPFGPVYELHRKHFGSPSNDVVIVKAPGWAMNPEHWTSEKCAELKERDEAVYATDVAAEFTDKILSFIPSEAVEACTNLGCVREMPQDGWEYVAAMDPATRGNAWTVGIAGMSPKGVRHLVYARQWQGSASEPLSPEHVFEAMANDLRQYGVSQVSTDQWSFDALSDTAMRKGLYLSSVSSSSQTKVDWYSSLRAWLIDKQVSLLDIRELAQDLKRVQRRVTQTGISIELPLTGDGRHCDYAAMLSLLMSRPMPEPDAGILRQETYEARVERIMEETLLREQEEKGEENDL